MENQMIEWADYPVFAPSDAARRIVADVRGEEASVMLVREPFQADRWEAREVFDDSSFAYFGRLSFAKGIDIFAGMMTAAGANWPVARMTFLGRPEKMPFRRSNVEEYVKARLHSDPAHEGQVYRPLAAGCGNRGGGAARVFRQLLAQRDVLLHNTRGACTRSRAAGARELTDGGAPPAGRARPGHF